MFTVWPDTATLDTTPALPSPWSYSQIKQFFSLASRTAWTESLQIGFVHLHATPPLNQWLGEGCWIWGSSQVQSQHICVSRGTIGRRAEQSIGSQTEEESSKLKLGRRMCLCVCVHVCVCACMNSPFVKKNRSMDPWHVPQNKHQCVRACSVYNDPSASCLTASLWQSRESCLCYWM